MAYISIVSAKNGLTESELEDILSCDDDVLNDVYMYWTPPIRRLPPLLLVRLKTDLSSYLGKILILKTIIITTANDIFFQRQLCLTFHANRLHC